MSGSASLYQQKAAPAWTRHQQRKNGSPCSSPIYGPPQTPIGFPLGLKNAATTDTDWVFNVDTSKVYQAFRFEPSGSSTDPPGR